MKNALKMVCFASTIMVPTTAALADGDARAGQTLFEKQCARCHDTRPGKHSDQGRSLSDVLGRKAGGYVFYSSPAMMKSGITWTGENLDKYLENPRKFIPGNWMSAYGPKSYVWLPSKKERDDIIAFLKEISNAGRSY